MNVLVIGYGSIGQRHSRILSELGCTVAVVSQQTSTLLPVYRTILDALQAAPHPDYVIISNRTHHHYETLCMLRTLGYEGTILIEKPLFHKPLQSLISEHQYQHKQPLLLHHVFVAYNLRFHPVLLRLRQLLTEETILSVQVYAGQYLPDWRSTDYRNSYSAKRSEGGGVLRDLSHELDYVQWLFGTWIRITAIGGCHSHLELDSDDMYALLMSSSRCPAISIQINYLDRIHQRTLVVNTNAHTYIADLVQPALQIDHRVENFAYDTDFTYRHQHRALLEGNFTQLCTYEQAAQTVELIEQAEQAAISGRWIHA
ncbi:Predicted dehydrogenase [Paenibacillus sp. 1_12]|uniref:Gfo/Idh/MocA family protein n=1 Tax=Paenibacillus sp. 1_12 TaxID=1566278 RepID=UPI0008E97730|nr:Gfo/Idh/MocA family oxidoreductase [Paenibacillus sp. 1_12]SFK81382.1 Predicted dehydrogenase [Paenibacillus sp. 1_12]